MFLSSLIQKILALGVFVSAVSCVASEYPFFVKEPKQNGLIAEYCGKQTVPIGGWVTAYPVQVPLPGGRCMMEFYTKPVQSMRFIEETQSKTKKLEVILGDGHKAYIKLN